MVCHIADAVLAGGIRRAALISLFSADDEEMISCKSGQWWELNPQRGRANNSAVLLRNKLTEEFFFKLWEKIKLSGSGEPGIYLNNDKDWGTNPCCLTGDTKIKTNKGELSISEIDERIKVGESFEVLSYDLENNACEYQFIDASDIMRKDADVIELELEDGRTIKLTPDHKVYTENKGYVEAAKLTEEDILLSIQ
jgi:intein/homing endonuclease